MLDDREAAMLTDRAVPMVQVSAMGDVAPLDDQFGTFPKRSVPARLAPWIFGGDGTQCYALLDAAKIAHLPDMLAGALLDYDSLFQGRAGDELADVAPYLVRLEEGHRFTRHLFTRPGALGGFWGLDGGVFLRSAAPLAELRRQLRKYTRIQDDAGKWYYFRFWEPRVFRENVALYDAATFRAFAGPAQSAICPGRAEGEFLRFDLPRLGVRA